MPGDVHATYAHRFSGMEAQRDRVWQVLTRHFFQKWVGPGDVVLDLGAGYCEFINNIQAKEKVALDVNPETRQRAAPGVKVLLQDVTQPWPLVSNSVDVVFTSNFFEHLPAKSAIASCLEEVYRILRPGGHLIALGPNIRFCADIYWDFFDHYIPLSDRSLVEALELAGLRKIDLRPQFLPFAMKRKLPPNALLIRLYLAMPALWKLFGKQFLIVARKPHEATA